MSHPSWVCGLKHLSYTHHTTLLSSHPSWVCGLKHQSLGKYPWEKQSHPSWVCGLKLLFLLFLRVPPRVTPFVGVWIETAPYKHLVERLEVTPFVGVWIETRFGR